MLSDNQYLEHFNASFSRPKLAPHPSQTVIVWVSTPWTVTPSNITMTVSP